MIKNNSKKLNVGCGKDIKEGYVNLDVVKLPNVDVFHNLDKYPWPFKDNTFEEIICDNVLEHLESIIKPVEELCRISKAGGKIIVKVPIFPSVYAGADPTHKQFFTYMTFDYFRPTDALNYYSKARFKILKKTIVFHQYLPFLTSFFNCSAKMQKFYAMFLYSLIPANSLYFELEAVK
jgi:ubiquinone/menaquinone biosynthesis C-methylase UbiE